MPLPAQRLATRPVAWGGLRRAVLSLSAALLALLLGSVSGPLRPAAAAGEPRVVTAADDGRLVNLRRGEQLRVVLNETAGTGYSWDIEHNDPKL